MLSTTVFISAPLFLGLFLVSLLLHHPFRVGFVFSQPIIRLGFFVQSITQTLNLRKVLVTLVLTVFH